MLHPGAVPEWRDIATEMRTRRRCGRLLDPPALLLARLAASLDALGTGAVDLPERQRTLRATVAWSVGLLEDPERSLEAVAVFTDGWTIPAAVLRARPRWRRRVPASAR